MALVYDLYMFVKKNNVIKLKMLDTYLKCVSDTNDEVVLKSLSILDSLLMLLNDHINNLDNIVNQVVLNINSSNPLIPSAALKGLDSIMEIFGWFIWAGQSFCIYLLI